MYMCCLFNVLLCICSTNIKLNSTLIIRSKNFKVSEWLSILNAFHICFSILFLLAFQFSFFRIFSLKEIHTTYEIMRWYVHYVLAYRNIRAKREKIKEMKPKAYVCTYQTNSLSKQLFFFLKLFFCIKYYNYCMKKKQRTEQSKKKKKTE